MGDAGEVETLGEQPTALVDAQVLHLHRHHLRRHRVDRLARNGDWEMLASERSRGRFSRQLVLGDNLDLAHIEADYSDDVLKLVVPVAEKAKPRKIQVGTGKHATKRVAVDS